MGRPKIKKSLDKMIKRVCKDYNRFLWKDQFGSVQAGPNKGANCEDCRHYQSGECTSPIPPEECIEGKVDCLILNMFNESLLEAVVSVDQFSQELRNQAESIDIETLDSDDQEN
jgi:hypothetical protein